MQNIVIKVIIPNAGMTRETLDMREEMLMAQLATGTKVSVDCISGGPETIESLTDEELASQYILREAIKAEQEGANAFVVYCFSDPAVEACRELVSIPVVGPGSASLALASTFTDRIGVITTRQDNVLRTQRRLARTVYKDLICSVRSLGIDVALLREDEATTSKALRNACRLTVEDGAVAVILGCLGMASYGAAVSAELGVPVIDPAFVALFAAETMAKLGVKHNRNDLPMVSASTSALLLDS